MAGSTGRLGARVTRELLAQGNKVRMCNNRLAWHICARCERLRRTANIADRSWGVGGQVRAGARNTDKAEAAALVAQNYGVLTADEASRLEFVYLDLEDEQSIEPAIGSASRVRLMGAVCWSIDTGCGGQLHSSPTSNLS